VGLAESNAITAPVSSPVTITWMGMGNSALPTKNSLVVLAGFEPATSKLCAGPATNKLCQGWWHIHSATVSPTRCTLLYDSKRSIAGKLCTFAVEEL